jgi:TolB-like protein/predicted Ser/Thr protein kinase/predicted Zn-dependent protease
MIGQTLGHYRVQDKLGAGGMGVVYRAWDTRLERVVAIKVVSDQPGGAADKSHERLLREARLASSLNHPHICTIHEVGEADGHVYCVMEYVQGQRLRDVVPLNGLPPEAVIRHGIQIADALARAHEKGIIHRDLKTTNVMVTPEGRIKVLDFGLAKRLPSEELPELTTRSDTAVTAARDSSLTAAGQVAGTLHYLAPELLRGKPADERTDLWALGVLLYEAAAGQVPFKGATSFEVTSAILSQPPRPLPSRVAPALQSIILRCLAKEPGERYQHALEVRAALEAVQSSGTATVVVAPRALSRRVVLGAAALAAVLLVGFGLSSFLARRTATDSVAVLPFQNVGGGAETEYLSDGIPENVIASLTRLPGLKVIGFGSVARYKDRPFDARQAAQELGVAALVTGRVVQRPDGLMVSAELVSGKDLRRLWGEQYSEKASDLLKIQDELTREIAQQLRPRVTPEQQKQLTRHDTDDTEAYKLYLKGRYHWYTLTAEGYQKSLALFREAIDRDPSYALAYAGMAATYSSMAIEGVRPPGEAMPLAQAAATKAIEIDERLGEAHSNLADIKIYGHWDFEGGQAERRRALELNPNDALIRRFDAQALRITRRWDDAVAEMRRSLELDPLSSEAHKTLGAILEWAGRDDEAIAAYRRAIELDPKAGALHGFIADVLARQGLEKPSIDERVLLLRATGDEESGAALASDYAQVGYRETMRRLWQQTLAGYEERARSSYVSPIAFAYAYAALEDKDQAFSWLEKAFKERSPWIVYLAVDPQFAGLRGDPRFSALVRRIGLP